MLAALIGAAGVDVPLSGVQAALSQVKPFELGYVSVLSNGGVYIANPDAAKLGKPAQDLPAEALAAVKAGKTFREALNKSTSNQRRANPPIPIRQ